VAIFAVRKIDLRFEQRVIIEFYVRLGKTSTETLQVLRDAYGDEVDLPPNSAGGRRHENIEAIKAVATMDLTGIPKRHSPAAFRTCRNAGNSALIAGGTTSKGTGSISCEVEFCIFYRLILRTLRTKDAFFCNRLPLRVSSN
jgi:hypothetical protein